MDYKKMYTLLFNTITDSIDMLQKAQVDTEEQYISADEPVITVLPETGSDGEDIT